MQATNQTLLVYTSCIYEGIHQRFDLIRGKFFWKGVGNENKYHMIKWEALDKP
jgi:hypothetical protein